ncbi:hypothetical protein CHU98_g5321 [Xylaria longipes]|nr:hypothetical protein CHU98_g5321 [Xylaria longipes]
MFTCSLAQLSHKTTQLADSTESTESTLNPLIPRPIRHESVSSIDGDFRTSWDKYEASIAEGGLAYESLVAIRNLHCVYVLLRGLIPSDSGKIHTEGYPQHRNANEVWLRPTQKRAGIAGLCGGLELAAETASSENSRCRSFGLVCNFLPDVPDLQPLADDSIRSSVVRGGADPQPPLAGTVWTSNKSTSYQLDAKCQDFVTRYLGRSLITPDDPNMVEVNRKLLRLTFTHPFLMHASLAVALAYDRYQNTSLGSRRTLEECYHWYQSTVLFNRRLREPIETKDKDPIWGTAAALAVLSFSAPDACTAEESWPLKPSDPSELEWLLFSRHGIHLRSYALTFASERHRWHTRALAIVCHLEDSSTAETNAYFNAAHAVSQIQGLSDSQVTTGHTQLFTRSIEGSFKYLLREKDPVALLLLYLWYRKAGRSIWWIELRARVECPSICSYLRLYHKEHGAVHAFLPGGSPTDG